MLKCVTASKPYSIVGEAWLVDESAVYSLFLSAFVRGARCKIARKARSRTAGDFQFSLQHFLRTGKPLRIIICLAF
jgi:hypothetical protein